VRITFYVFKKENFSGDPIITLNLKPVKLLSYFEALLSNWGCVKSYRGKCIAF